MKHFFGTDKEKQIEEILANVANKNMPMDFQREFAEGVQSYFDGYDKRNFSSLFFSMSLKDRKKFKECEIKSLHAKFIKTKKGEK